MRFSRHAHTEGLTYCTVLIPASFNGFSTRKLKSGASMPINTSGGLSIKCCTNCLRIFSKRGKRPRTSTNPITDSSSISNSVLQPCACILGPAIPSKIASGKCALSAFISPSPKISPDSSPATIPIRSCFLSFFICYFFTSKPGVHTD